MTNLKKLNLLYENLDISHCQYKKCDIWKTGPDIGATAPLSGYKRRHLYVSGAYIEIIGYIHITNSIYIGYLFSVETEIHFLLESPTYTTPRREMVNEITIKPTFAFYT